jgi:transcriptional regulatory protein RtcR
VLIGLLGPQLDGPVGPARWSKWRPSVAACAQPDLVIDRFELLVQRPFEALGQVVADDIRGVSPGTELRVHPVDMPDPWDFEGVYAALAGFAAAYPFDLDREDYLIHITTGTHVAQICLFLLTETRQLPGLLLQTRPGSRRDSQHGGFSTIDLHLARYDQIARRSAEARTEATGILKDGIDTRSPAFNAMIDEIERVATQSTAPVLLTGPTGAGKTRLARLIYALKRSRRLIKGEFVELNCATLRGDGAMSALFGHVRGAFTGAAGDRPGLLRRGDGGLVFLDEIGELGLDEQAMLLRAVEERRFLPVGSDREVSSDFQLVCGTNRDLLAEVQAGRFREDLLARLDTWTFRLPGLAERREDLPANLDHELERFARASNRRVTFNAEARARFLAFGRGSTATWTRNFRDLSAAVTRMATLAPGGRITEAEVAAEEARLRRAWGEAAAPTGGGGGWRQTLDGVLSAEGIDELDLVDAVQLACVVEVCRRSPSLAAAGRELYAASRARRSAPNDSDRLRKYLARFGLDFDGLKAPR